MQVLAPIDTTPHAFADPAQVTQSWFVVARSKALRPRRVRSFAVLGRRIAVYRTPDGTLHALDARCPHLGADLGEGRVVDDTVQCAFHGWRLGPDGTCRHAPGLAALPDRRTRSYPVQERWGLIWLFNGEQPLFDLPGPPEDAKVRVLCPPSQTIRCHPHLVIANGLDTGHFQALHGMRLTAEPTLLVDPPYRIAVGLQGHPRSTTLRRLTGTTRADIQATFSTLGGHLAWLEIETPTRFWVLFTARPTPDGCATQVVLFLPRGLAAARAFATVYLFLHDDRRILDSLQFQPDFVESDAPMAAFARLVNQLPVG